MKSNLSFAGIDVSKAKLDVNAEIKGNQRTGEFRNDAEGHRALVKWLTKTARVCVEATGVYHLQLCLALRKAGIAVMVVNPRQARDFASSMNVRSKTDRVDAAVLLEYVRRMPFVEWNAPSVEVMNLRELSRRMHDLTQMASDDKKRRRAFVAARSSRAVLNDVDVNIRHLNKRIALLEHEALEVVRSNAKLSAHFEAVMTITGIGTRTAIHLMAELLLLDPEMTTRQVVAYAGLDPREEQSGQMKKPSRISRVGNARVRATLFLPALTCARKDAAARHFCNRLVARGKRKMQAIVAVMRKLLHATWTLLQRGGSFDATKLFPLDAAALEVGQRSPMAESSDSAITAPQPKVKKNHPKGRSEAKERQLDSSQPEATAAA